MTALAPEVVSMPERVALVMARDLSSDRRSEIPGLFERFFASGVVIGDLADKALVGISFNMDEAGAFRYGVGRIVTRAPESVPAGFETLTLPAGDNAVFRHFGPVSKLPPLFDRIFSGWLPESGYALRHDPVIERYPDDERNGPNGMAFEIWVPIKR